MLKGIQIPVFWSLSCIAYRMVLRPLLKAAIDDPNQEWDDIFLAVCDRIFNYTDKD